MMQAKGINKQRKKRGAAAPVAKSTKTVSTSVLFDTLESYDQVLSCASKGKLRFCTVPDLYCVLKMNGFQSFHLTKDYIEKNFSGLSRVLFQTRFSSLKTEDTVITAVVLEDSEVVQDLAALQWLDGASKVLVRSSSEEGTRLGERQPDRASEVNLDGLSDDMVAAISSFQPVSHPVDETTDLVELSADDCYRPDMSMIVMLDSIEARGSTSMCSPDQRGVVCSQEEIQLMNPASQPEGKLLTQPSMHLCCFEGQPQLPSPLLLSYDNTGFASQEEQVAQSSHTSRLANVESSDARAKLDSEEEDMIEKFPPLICQTSESSSTIMCKLPFINEGVMKIPNQNHRTLPFQAKSHIIFAPEAQQLTQRDCEELSKVEEQSSFSSVSSSGLVEEPAQPCLSLSDSDCSAISSQEIHQAEVISESEEEFDLVEKFVMEQNVLHGLFEEDDLSDIELLDETVSEGSLRVVANVHDFVELEEDLSSVSCQIQDVQVNSPLNVVPSPQQTSSAEGNSVGFLGLLAQVCTGGHSLKYSNCDLEGQHAMFNAEARSCAKRLFTESEAEGTVEREAALPYRTRIVSYDYGVITLSFTI